MIIMNNANFEEMINEIIDALQEKGYNPFEQLRGYVSLGDDSYITRHRNAREKIQKLDKEQISTYLKERGW